MRNSNSMNVARRHVLAHCSVLAWAQCVGGLPAQAAQPVQQGAATPVILVVGDSISAEYGLPRGKGWVALMQARLSSLGSTATVVNASISGDTTSGGLARLADLLKQHHPSHVLIELGGNDALRGLDLRTTQNNLAAMARAAKAAGAQVTLVGMQVPPNYGSAYANEFSQLFARVAQQEKTALVPFLLKGVADGPDPTRLFQADRIHPNEQAHPQLLDNVWTVLEPQLLKRPKAR
jgi:acyl-CoA thioesterase-1